MVKLSFGTCPGNSLTILWTNTSSSSVAKLAYSDAQRVIDGQQLGDLVTDPSHNSADVSHDITLLQSLAKKLRAQRFQSGTLSLESLKLSFTLDENGLPTDCGQYERKEANTMIEEVIPLLLSILILLNR